MVNEVKRFNATTKKGYCCCKKKGSTTTSNLSVSEDVNYSENFIKQDVPFSITYADMMRRNPPVQIRQIFKAPAKQVNIDTSKPSTKCPYAAAKLGTFPFQITFVLIVFSQQIVRNRGNRWLLS